MIFDFILSSSKQNAGISLRSVYKNIAYHEWLINKLWAQVSTFNGLAPINNRRGQVLKYLSGISHLLSQAHRA